MSEVTSLPAEGLARIGQIIKPHGVVPVCRTEWYDGIAKGIYPAPVKKGRASFWKVSDIRALLDRFCNGELGPDFSSASREMAQRAKTREANQKAKRREIEQAPACIPA